MAARPPTRRAGLGLGPRLALFVALALTLGIGVVATIAIWRETAGLIEDARAGAKRDTGIVADTLGGAVRFNKPENVTPALAKLREGQEDALAWQVALDANGDEVARETHLSDPDPAALSAALQTVLTTGEAFYDAGLSAAPIRFGPENAVVGALVVGWSDAPILAEARARAAELAAIGLALAAAFAALGYWALARMVARPISGLDRCLTALARGELDVAVPSQDAGAEIGAMARNMESLRGALAEAQAQRRRMAEVERRAVEEREAMLEALRSSVGSVVAAAEAGDFSRRVERSFDDATLQSLAGGVNALSGVFAAFLDDGETALSALARGDLTRSMAQTHRGRLGTFADAVNATLASLAALVADLRTAEAAIGATVLDVSRDSDKLSERADMLATALQETSATMVELATTISNNADHARASADRVGDARGQADASREMIDRAIAAMKDIQSGTQEISEIVNAIDGFAFQTNLLALNAAVEAARAGEAGKGFAVVATEVRTLAQRAAEAAKDIRRLIGESRTNVDRGAAIVDQTGAALSEILTSFVGIAPAMADISSATREQSTGMGELTTALNQIDEATQLTAHLAEKGALHAQQLSAQATTLGRLVAFFKTDPRLAHAALRAAE